MELKLKYMKKHVSPYCNIVEHVALQHLSTAMQNIKYNN